MRVNDENPNNSSLNTSTQEGAAVPVVSQASPTIETVAPKDSGFISKAQAEASRKNAPPIKKANSMTEAMSKSAQTKVVEGAENIAETDVVKAGVFKKIGAAFSHSGGLGKTGVVVGSILGVGLAASAVGDIFGEKEKDAQGNEIDKSMFVPIAKLGSDALITYGLAKHGGGKLAELGGRA